MAARVVAVTSGATGVAIARTLVVLGAERECECVKRHLRHFRRFPARDARNSPGSRLPFSGRTQLSDNQSLSEVDQNISGSLTSWMAFFINKVDREYGVCFPTKLIQLDTLVIVASFETAEAKRRTLVLT